MSGAARGEMTWRLFGSLPVLALVLAKMALAPDPALAQEARQRPTVLAGCPVEPAKFYPCATAKAKTYNPPRTPQGLPDLSGFWSRLVSTEDIHERPEVVGQRAQKSLIVDPPDGKIPYLPWAAAQKKTNFAKYISPRAFCEVPGIPRSTFMSGLWQIMVRPELVAFLQQEQTTRIIRTDGSSHPGKAIKMWMGDSRGRWDGNTLVVDVTNLNGKPWIDAAGDFETDNVHVVERFTLIDKDTIFYAATLEDPTTYAGPWTISFPIPRYDAEDDPEVWEEACHEGNLAVEPLLKGGYNRFPGVVAPQGR